MKYACKMIDLSPLREWKETIKENVFNNYYGSRNGLGRMEIKGTRRGFDPQEALDLSHCRGKAFSKVSLLEGMQFMLSMY